MNPNSRFQSQGHWHAAEIEAVLARLESRADGLSGEEVQRRLRDFGPNRLRPTRQRSALRLFLNQFKNLLVYVLLLSAGVTVLIGHWIDAAVIFGVVLLNAVIGFVQEGKAEKALEAIRNLLSAQATVIREGRRMSIPSDQLVPGDIVLLQAGDKVPADLRLYKIKNLRIDEAMLTGESVPVEKSMAPVELKATIGDRLNMAFSGTLVTYGQGTGVVVATGDHTEIGRISALLALAPPMTTRLLRKMAAFSRTLTIAIGALAAVTLAFGIFIRQYQFGEMFLAAVGLAVAAIPEGLPAILTITLAIGVQRMAQRHAIVRRLPSVETLGSVTVICSDKTGTLTRNEMMVKTVATADDWFEVGGNGYAPSGTFLIKGEELTCHLAEGKAFACNRYPALVDLARGALLCNEASLHQVDDSWQVQGDPTEGALVSLGMKAGLDPAELSRQWPHLDMIPFDSEYQFMATLHRDASKDAIIFIKGAPERILEKCAYQRQGGKDVLLEHSFWHDQIYHIASRGQRPLAVASKRVTNGKAQLSLADVEGDLTLLGVVGIIDPPRDSAISAIQKCKSAGIRVKMITGDHVLTALAIAAEMGIGDGVTALTGREINDLSEDRLQALVQKVDVFARVIPEHKLRLVKALQTAGEVVAMTGDGVNDAPALKQADIGVAMGIKGTEAAKEAAEMVLTDDNFASIEHAVEEGRTVYDNIKKAIMFILPTNGGEAGIIIAAIAFGRLLPITPVQILWVNMITAVTLALSLAFEPPEQKVMQRPPRNPQESILSPFLVWRIGFVSFIMVAGTFGLFLWERNAGVSIEAARTVAVNTLVGFEVFYLFSSRYIHESAFTREGFLGSSYALAAIGLVVVLQLLFTYATTMQKLFGTRGITGSQWARIVAIAVCILILVEIEKWIWRRRRQK